MGAAGTSRPSREPAGREFVMPTAEAGMEGIMGAPGMRRDWACVGGFPMAGSPGGGAAGSFGGSPRPSPPPGGDQAGWPEGGVEVSGPCPGTRRGGRLVPVGVAPGMLNPEAGAAVGAAGEVTVCPQLGHGPLIPAMLDGTVSWVRHAPHSNWMTSNITPE